MTPRITLPLASLLAAHLVAPGMPAYAQRRSENADLVETARARAIFSEAVAHADRGEWAQAAERFERVLVLRPTPILRFNLASALTHLNRYVESSELLQQVVDDAYSPADVREAARALLSTVKPHVGRLMIRVVGSMFDTVVTVDARPLHPALVGVGMPMDPGRYMVAALRSGAEVASSPVTVSEGSLSQVELSLPEPVRPVLTGGQSRRGSHEAANVPSWMFWAGTAALVVGAAVGTYFLIQHIHDDNDGVRPTAAPASTGLSLRF